MTTMQGALDGIGEFSVLALPRHTGYMPCTPAQVVHPSLSLLDGETPHKNGEGQTS
jgi:hypothetical protein